MNHRETENTGGRGLGYNQVMRFHVVLHEPEIPQNTGNIGRTCVAVDAKLWLVQPLGFRMDERRLKRAGLDYWDHLDYEIVDSWQDYLTKANSSGRMWLFTKTAQREYTTAEFQVGDHLVFGSETKGLPASLLNEFADRTLRIPMRSPVRSLNLSNAVAIALYEANRQAAGDTEG